MKRSFLIVASLALALPMASAHAQKVDRGAGGEIFSSASQNINGQRAEQDWIRLRVQAIGVGGGVGKTTTAMTGEERLRVGIPDLDPVNVEAIAGLARATRVASIADTVRAVVNLHRDQALREARPVSLGSVLEDTLDKYKSKEKISGYTWYESFIGDTLLLTVSLQLPDVPRPTVLQFLALGGGEVRLAQAN
jgi:hypothetical protein